MRKETKVMGLVEIAGNPVPPGAEVAKIKAHDGVGIRVVRWAGSTKEKGTVVICPGRGEFIEKYFETAGELLRRGFSVAALDWRGQGRSDRLLRDRSKGHIAHFSHYHRDLAALETQWLLPYCPKPWFALAHSMGGAILLDYAARGQSPFERLVLSAPMIALFKIKSRGMIAWLIKALRLTGCGGFYVPQGNNQSIMTKAFEGNVLTSDVKRFARMGQIIEAGPDLAIGDPTIAWLDAAFALMRQFEDFDYARNTLDPLLILAAGDDEIVDTDITEKMASRLKAGSCITLALSRHEILAEQDTVRAQFWAAFDAFITAHAQRLAEEAAGVAMNVASKSEN